MANYATNIFYARTENKADLDKIEAFLDDTFDGFVNRHSDSVDAEFTSRWVYPEEEIDRLSNRLSVWSCLCSFTLHLSDWYTAYRRRIWNRNCCSICSGCSIPVPAVQTI